MPIVGLCGVTVFPLFASGLFLPRPFLVAVRTLVPSQAGSFPFLSHRTFFFFTPSAPITRTSGLYSLRFSDFPVSDLYLLNLPLYLYSALAILTKLRLWLPWSNCLSTVSHGHDGSLSFSNGVSHGHFLTFVLLPVPISSSLSHLSLDKTIHDRGVVILPVHHLDNTPSLFVTYNLFQGDRTEISVSNVRLTISLQGPCHSYLRQMQNIVMALSTRHDHDSHTSWCHRRMPPFLPYSKCLTSTLTEDSCPQPLFLHH